MSVSKMQNRKGSPIEGINYRLQKPIMLAVAALLIAFVGFWLYNRFETFLSLNNAWWKIYVTRNIQIDFYGAILPAIFSVTAILCLVHFRKFTLRYYLLYFPFPVAIALLLSSVNPNAVTLYYRALAMSASILVIFVAFYDKGPVVFLRSRAFRELKFSKGNYLNALLAVFSYSSLSSLIVDLVYVSILLWASGGTWNVYIGGMGFMDGIFLSGLFSLLSMSFVVILAMIIYELAFIINECRSK